jgi:hypothetical protein
MIVPMVVTPTLTVSPIKAPKKNNKYLRDEDCCLNTNRLVSRKLKTLATQKLTAAAGMTARCDLTSREKMPISIIAAIPPVKK